MLFHGTGKKGVAGILETGYRNSIKGDFGRGVYLTESPDLASIYSDGRNPSPKIEKKNLTSCLSTKFSSRKSCKQFSTIT